MNFRMNTELLITSALRLAAEQYEKDAQTVSPIPGLPDSFKRQALAANALVNLIEARGLAYAVSRETISSSDC